MFEHVSVHKDGAKSVWHVALNRPQKRNAVNLRMWREIGSVFREAAVDSSCRSIILSGNGKTFCAGIDLSDLQQAFLTMDDTDVSRKAFYIKQMVDELQSHFTALEKCSKPVIAAIHGACVGAAVDITSACDIRYCSQDAWFQIKEVDLGIAADVGTLQRFPKIVGNDSLTRELAYTAKTFHSDEALRIGFVSRVLPDYATVMAAARTLAELIAEKSPVAVQATKENLVFSRDHSVEEGLKHVLTWNQAMLQSADLLEAVSAAAEKRKPIFSKL